MKKLSIKRLRRKQEQATPSRITNETVAEHREKILAGGRKFKYPVQYAKHRLVFNALLVTIGVSLLLAIIGWWQLYPMQNSSAFMYRIVRLVPVPVAIVNGEQALYRDYLVQYRGSEYYLDKYDDIRLDTDDGKRQLDYIRRQSLDKAELIAYARQLSREHGIVVSDKEIDDFIDKERNTANGRVSRETYDASIKMLYDQTAEDYRLSVANGILKRKVAFAVDTNASNQVKRAQELIQSSQGDFVKVAEQMAGAKGAKIVVGQSGMLDSAGKYGGLRVSDVTKLSVGEVSGPLESTTDDGYYVVKITNKSDTQVDFQYVHVPLSTFKSNFEALKKNGKITEFIKLKDK